MLYVYTYIVQRFTYVLKKFPLSFYSMHNSIYVRVRCIILKKYKIKHKKFAMLKMNSARVKFFSSYNSNKIPIRNEQLTREYDDAD